MKKYLITFSLFIVSIAVIFLLIRTDNHASASSTSEKVAETATANEEAVLIKKGELNTGAKAKLLKNLSGDYYMGNVHAPVLMIEYASLSCPHCANFHEKVLDDLIVSHINTGKLRYIYRDFPLNAPALDASKLAMCGDKKNYFNFIKILFKSQPSWVISDDYRAVLKNIGKLGGVSEEQFEKCLADKSVDEKILKTKQAAIEVLGVKSTPTIFINGIDYEGEHTHEAVSKYIDSLLKAPEQH